MPEPPASAFIRIPSPGSAPSRPTRAPPSLGETFRSLPLEASLVAGARVVLLRLPRALDALDDIAGLIAAHAHPEVVVFAGGRIKHMTLAMNDVLGRSFATLDVSHARQKSRVLDRARTARRPRSAGAHSPPRRTRPERAAHASARSAERSRERASTSAPGSCSNSSPRPMPMNSAASGRCDRPRVRHGRDRNVADAAVSLAHRGRERPVGRRGRLRARHGRANGVADRVQVVRDLGLESRPDSSARLIALNPPFHAGTAVPMSGVADPLFAEAGRVLAPGGELWAVWNSSLHYRPALERLVGPTRQVARNAKFTVTVSTRR